MKAKNRCTWVGEDELMQQYHDTEWCVPIHNDTKLFEFLLLETFQAGLSWKTILHKRESFRNAFDNFDYTKIALYDSKKKRELLKNPGIIRNKLKIESAVHNARVFMDIQKEYGSFDEYVWKFVNGKVKINKQKSMADMPTTTEESDALSKNLKKRGMKFVGSTTMYAFMQAIGMVNDHEQKCFRYNKRR